jgi:hypothetical protein
MGLRAVAGYVDYISPHCLIHITYRMPLPSLASDPGDRYYVFRMVESTDRIG